MSKRTPMGKIARMLTVGFVAGVLGTTIAQNELVPFESANGWFSLSHPLTWTVAEHPGGTGVVLANSAAALERFAEGAPAASGDVVMNVGFLPHAFLRQRELRPLDIQFEATPEVFLASLLPMFRLADDAVFGDAERVPLDADRDAGRLTVSDGGREGMILVFPVSGGVVAVVSTVGYPGERSEGREVAYEVAATVVFSGDQEALYGALLGG